MTTDNPKRRPKTTTERVQKLTAHDLPRPTQPPPLPESHPAPAASILTMFNITPQQARWAQEYMIDFNEKHAAIRAGYEPTVALRAGQTLAEDPYVMAYVDYLVAQEGARTGITAERVRREYARLAFLDPADVMTWGKDGLRLKSSDEMTADDRAAIAEITEVVTVGNTMRSTLRVKLADKLTALAVLAKHTRVLRDGPDTLLVDNSKTVNVFAADSILERLRQARASGVTMEEIAAAVMPELPEKGEPEDRP